MKAIVLTSANQWALTDVDEPRPGANEVVVAVEACGLCGTDLHTLAGTNRLVRFPVIPGHEFVGSVVTTGGDVTQLSVGARVAVDPSGSCGQCRHCHGGWHNLCPDKGGYGSRLPGGFAEYVAVRETSCVRIDTDVSWPIAALAEPLACVLHGMDRLGPVVGKTALIYGAGPIGLLAGLLLQRSGAHVQVVDHSCHRRRLAAATGLCEIREIPDEDTDGWDVVVDATGSVVAMEDAFVRLRRAGTLLLLGVAPQDEQMRLQPWAINWHELTILGAMAVRHTFHRAVELLPQLRPTLAYLVTDSFPLSQFDQALTRVQKQQSLKVQLRAR